MSEPTSAPQPRAATHAELSRLVRRLSKAGDSVGVVRLVERWSEEAELPRDARLAAGRAFLDLRLMDRAWVQLRELTDQDAGDLEAQALTAEMFIERGWSDRARKPLERIERVEPAHPRLRDLRGRLDAPPPRPPPDARKIEREGTLAERLELAEVYLRSGSILRAQGILERLKRGDGDVPPRVESLLWGVRGDFTSADGDLMSLARDLRATLRAAAPVPSVRAPTLTPRGALMPDPAEWEGLDRTESGVSDPETAEISKSALGAQLAGGRGDPAFPSLFRGSSTDSGGGSDDDEVTVASVMADAEDMADPPTFEDTDASLDVGAGLDSGDTQIMAFIQSGGERRLEPYRGEDAADEARDQRTGPIDLRALQREGPAASVPEPDDDDATNGGFLEEEDQDLVVMTRRQEPAGGEPEAPRGRRGPIEVVEKVPEPPPLPEGLPGQDEDTPSMTPLVPDLRPDLPPAAAPTTEPVELVGPEPRTRTLGRLFVAVLVFALVAAAAIFAAQRWLFKTVAADVVSDVHQRLAHGSFGELREGADALTRQLDGSGGASGVVAAELALLQGVLWSEYTGDPADRAAALSALEVARESSAPADEVALAEATLALADGHLPDAGAALARLSEPGADTEVARVLQARLLLEGGDPAAAWGHLNAAGGASGARHAVWAPVIQSATDSTAGAQAATALLEDRPADPLVRLTALEQGWLWADAARRLDAVRALLRSNEFDAPRLRARAHRVEAALLESQGATEPARAAREQAARLDPRSATTLYATGAGQLLRGEVLASERSFVDCLEARRADAACQRGLVHARLELDRVTEARAATTGWTEAGLDVSVLEAWVALAEGEPALARERASGALGDRAEGEPARRSTGLAWYVTGLALGEEGTDGAKADEALGRASRVLAASRDPLLRQLARRSGAARVEFGPSVQAADRAAALGADQATDPVLHLHLGRFLEGDGERSRARAHFDRAAELGRENAQAHYARGLFYYAPETQDQAVAAWRRYLDLGPSGPRAERVRQRIHRL